MADALTLPIVYMASTFASENFNTLPIVSALRPRPPTRNEMRKSNMNMNNLSLEGQDLMKPLPRSDKIYRTNPSPITAHRAMSTVSNRSVRSTKSRIRMSHLFQPVQEESFNLLSLSELAEQLETHLQAEQSSEDELEDTDNLATDTDGKQQRPQARQEYEDLYNGYAGKSFAELSLAIPMSPARTTSSGSTGTGQHYESSVSERSSITQKSEVLGTTGAQPAAQPGSTRKSAVRLSLLDEQEKQPSGTDQSDVLDCDEVSPNRVDRNAQEKEKADSPVLSRSATPTCSMNNPPTDVSQSPSSAPRQPVRSPVYRLPSPFEFRQQEIERCLSKRFQYLLASVVSENMSAGRLSGVIDTSSEYFVMTGGMSTRDKAMEKQRHRIDRAAKWFLEEEQWQVAVETSWSTLNQLRSLSYIFSFPDEDENRNRGALRRLFR